MSNIKFSLEYDFLLKDLEDIHWLKHLNQRYRYHNKYDKVPLNEIVKNITPEHILKEAYFFEDLEKERILIDMNQNLNTETPINFIGKRINFKIESVQYELINPNDDKGNYVIKNPKNSQMLSVSPKDLKENDISVHTSD